MNQIRLLLAGIAVALVLPAAALAGYWTWGFNYMSNTTQSGDCSGWFAHGACSGWNYWTDNRLDKRGGGRIEHGFINANGTAGQIRCCTGLWYIYPSDFGMGGYLKSYAKYFDGEPSYLKVSSVA